MSGLRPNGEPRTAAAAFCVAHDISPVVFGVDEAMAKGKRSFTVVFSQIMASPDDMADLVCQGDLVTPGALVVHYCKGFIWRTSDLS